MPDSTDPSPATPSHPTIHQAMAAVMRSVGAVSKDQVNSHQRYKFRGIDDFLSAIAGPLRAHGVIMMPEVIDARYEVRGGDRPDSRPMNTALLTVRFTFYGPAGDSISCTTLGEASDVADKAANKAMSAALKYALLIGFAIPVEAVSVDDSDRHHPESAPSALGDFLAHLREPQVWNDVQRLQAAQAQAEARHVAAEPVATKGGGASPLREVVAGRINELHQRQQQEGAA